MGSDMPRYAHPPSNVSEEGLEIANGKRPMALGRGALELPRQDSNL